MATPWEFWIDVGGTFTDCIARSPDQRLVTAKVLSSGVTKGQVDEVIGRDRLADSLRTKESDTFWVGYTIRFLDDFGSVIHTGTIAHSIQSGGVLRVDQMFPESIGQGTRYELASGEEAPILAIRYILGLKLTDSIPPVIVKLGTTRGTNALLTRRGARTEFVTTKGFGDVLLIGNQDRPRLFDLAIKKPEPLFEQVVEIDERLDANGNVLKSPQPDDVRRQLEAVRASGIQSIAICLLHAFANGEHERIIEQIARDVGFTEISTSSRLSPLIKIVSRGDTTVADAYLNPILRAYVGRLRQSLEGQGRDKSRPSALKLMTSAGGLVDADHFVGKDSILSGPAGGVIGFSRVAQQAGFEKSIGFDMGGTSTDVSRFDGRYELEFETQKAGVRIVSPMLSIETVAAGGGSICGFDGVKLFVGPQSAGADPGPACYGRGGPLTITDVNVFLGRVLPQYFPFPLDVQAVERQLTKLCDEIAASPLGRRYSPVELADGFRQIANANMVRAIRKISVAKGYDPADYVLVSFGGAGAQHACALAEQLGMNRILVHPYSGLLSAYGIGLADVRRFAQRSVLRPLEDPADLARVFEELATEALAGVRAEGVPDERIAPPVRSLDLRYRGVESIINVIEPTDGDYARAYAEQHERLYGYVHSNRPLEVVAARVEVVGHMADPPNELKTPIRRSPVPAQRTKVWFGRLTGIPSNDDLYAMESGKLKDLNQFIELILGAKLSRAHQPIAINAFLMRQPFELTDLINVCTRTSGESPQVARTTVQSAIAALEVAGLVKCLNGDSGRTLIECIRIESIDVPSKMQWLETNVFHRNDLHAGDRIVGPAIVCEPTSTVVIEPNWRAMLGPYGEIVLERWDMLSGESFEPQSPLPQDASIRGTITHTNQAQGPSEAISGPKEFKNATENLSEVFVPDTIIGLIPESVARANTVFPLRQESGTLVIAMADPLNLQTIEKLKFILNCEIAVAAAPRQDILAAIDRHYRQPPSGAQSVDPVLLEIFNNLFASIAEQMGVTLQKTSVSTNVKERLDFSCAIFTPTGDLVVNAPHIPVHLGAMSETVKQLIRDVPDIAPGDVYVTNDPFRGGSHLPDVTVITPVHEPATGELLFFTASRAHHAEIGGTVPGSMPPFSKNLAEEGVLIRCFKLVDGGRSHEDELRKLLTSGPLPTRNVQDNLSDIAAQVAANKTGVEQLLELVRRYSLPVVQAYMQHIQSAAAEKMRRALTAIADGEYAFTDHLDDGSPIHATITIQGDRATVDFTGTGPVLRTSNLNANRAIVTAAVLYVFRCLINEDIPLNSGVLEPVEIILPECLLNPPSTDDPSQCVAIVGGNVETSQRVVDVLLGALQLAAASQGTMNNLTFGDGTFGYYETICGGSGATRDANGADAVHTHMTNTRLTDVEVIERRYPVRVQEFSIRRGSGGAGQHRGGDGIVRRIEFLKPLTVSLLTERRGPYAPFGLAGANSGAMGINSIAHAASGRLEQLPGKVRLDVQAGDVLTVETPGAGGYGGL